MPKSWNSLKADSLAESEKRKGTDRRRKATNPFSLTAFRGRRHSVRRAEDRRRFPYTDQQSRRLFLFALMTILLCSADGLYTIYHVSRGAVELNPFMNYLLGFGPYVFFSVKFILSALCLILLVMHIHHPVGRIVLGSVALLYGSLFSYHLHLFFTQ
jgi:hypothetical protein